MTGAQPTTEIREHAVNSKKRVDQGAPLTIREQWLVEFRSRIDLKYYNARFDYQTLRLLDEFRKADGPAIYNTAGQFVAKTNLAHLNTEARQEDECEPLCMRQIVNAYGGYHGIMTLLEKKLRNDHPRPMIFGSIPFSTFFMRDSLTSESDRIIREDPVIAALKLANHTNEIVRRFCGKGEWRAQKGINYIRKRMTARVMSYLAHWCHEYLPTDAVRCGLPKEPVRNEFEDGATVKLLYDLESLPYDEFDLSL
jgi:hypothetical protein